MKDLTHFSPRLLIVYAMNNYVLFAMEKKLNNWEKHIEWNDTASPNSIMPMLWAPNNTALLKLQNKAFTWDLFQSHVKKIQDTYRSTATNFNCGKSTSKEW